MKPLDGIRSFFREWEGPLSRELVLEPYFQPVRAFNGFFNPFKSSKAWVGPRYDTTSPRVGVEGNVDALSLWAGQSVGTIRDVLPAAEIVRAIMDDAQTALGSAARALAP